MSLQAQDPFWTIDATLLARGFAFERPPLVYRGPLSVHGIVISVEIDVPDITFVRMPTVRALDVSKLPPARVAHLQADGNICYFGQAGLPLDLYNPGGSILRVLAEAEAALERSFAGGAKAEFEAELADYLPDKRWFYLAVPRPSAPSVIEVQYGPVRNTDDSGIVVVPKGAWPLGRDQSLRSTNVLTFPKLEMGDHFPPNTLEDAVAYLKERNDLPSGWRQAVLKSAAEGEPLFLSAPNAIIGWTAVLPPHLAILRSIKGIRKSFLMAAVDRNLKNIGLEKKAGMEAELKTIVERNLVGRPNLIGRNIALIGCGTIGGYLASLLAQSGAGCEGELILYDIDTVSPGNIGRHVLGFSDLDRFKTEALRDHVKRIHPDIKVTSRSQDATRTMEALGNIDVIIDATGEPNVANALNASYLKLPQTANTALFHSWVFGNGVAAQSFANLRDQYACYRCLKTDFAGDWRQNPLKDPNSEARIAPGRCGEGDYIPFSADASITAAGLTLRAILDWAGGEPGQRLRTTVLDHHNGREKMGWSSPARLDSCPACGGH